MPLPVGVIPLPFEPEAPVTERLSFLTDVLGHDDDTEQRVALRPAPRQAFDLLYRVDDGAERSSLTIALQAGQAGTYALPVWTEPSLLTAVASTSATTLAVDENRYGDFRAGGYVIIFDTFDHWEILALTSAPTSTSFTLTDAVAKGPYPAGTRVMPCRLAITTSPAKEDRYPNNLADVSVSFLVTEHGPSLADASYFPTFNDGVDVRVLLDDPNPVEGTLGGTIARKLTYIDGDTGVFEQDSTSAVGRRTSAKSFVTGSRPHLWAVRRLLHYLRGRQVAFRLPTFSKELVLHSAVTSGDTAIHIEIVGYHTLVVSGSFVRIVLRDGTKIDRKVTGSSSAAGYEVLTLNSAIGQNIALVDVAYIDFVEKVRIDSDEITILHGDAGGNTSIGFPVRLCLE